MTAVLGALEGMKVVDLGVGMATALVARFLRDSGARVTRLEPPDGDPFYKVYPAYTRWHSGADVFSRAECSDERLEQLFAGADICVVGGESFPGLSWAHDAYAIAARHRHLVVLDVRGYPPGHREAGKPGVDLLLQARSGLTFEHYSDRPIACGFAAATYGVVFQGLIGTLAALYERQCGGPGQVVTTSLLQGALTWASVTLVEVDNPTRQFDLIQPKDPAPLIFQCADGPYIHIAFGTPGAKYRLYKILGIDDPTVAESDPGLPNVGGPVRTFFGDVDLIADYVRPRQSAELLEKLWKAGMAADYVLPPGHCWDHPQVRHNGVIRTEPDGGRSVGQAIAAKEGPAKSAPAPKPLRVLKALDFGQFMAGPYATAVLGDLGVETIKVELLSGDPNRGMFRCFSMTNRGKRSIAVDMKAPEGREIVHRLCRGADVVTSNFRPGVAERLGIDAASLHAMKPDLIVLESAGYGADGPNAGQASFDFIFQALCGHEHRAGGEGNEPLWNRLVPVDFAGALLAATGILAGLIRRARRGGGALFGVPLLNAGVFLLSELVQEPDGGLVGAPSLDADRAGFHPAERIYAVADGWIAVAARDDASARRMAQALDLPDVAAKPRDGWGPAEARTLAQAFAGQTAAAALAMLADREIWAERCLREHEADALHDADLVSIGSVYTTDDPVFGRLTQFGPLFTCSHTPAAGPGAAPKLGQHSRVILEQLGYGADQINSLFDRKIVA